jgi:hypothetical protein
MNGLATHKGQTDRNVSRDVINNKIMRKQQNIPGVFAFYKIIF